MADRRRGTEELLGRDPGQLGEQLVGAGGIGDHLPVHLQSNAAAGTPEVLGDTAQPPSLQVLLDEVELHDGPSIHPGFPAAECVDLRAGCRDPPEEPHLERPLERGLARFVGTADHGEPGRA